MTKMRNRSEHVKGGIDEIQTHEDDQPKVTPQRIANVITIKDIEGTVSHFSGDDQMRVERWIDEFEDMSELLQ